MRLAALLLVLPLSVQAWDKLPGYPEKLYAIQGKLVETTGSMKRNIEIVYAPKQKAFGVSFYNYNNKEDQAIIPGGTIQFRGCGKKANGDIYEAKLAFTKVNYIAFNSLSCGEEIYARVYDEFDNYGTYVFKNIPELRKR